MKNENAYLSGNTVRLIAEFKDFDGILTDVMFPKVTIYDYRYNKISEILLNEDNKLDVGKYFYDFVTDSKPKRIIYEFSGELDGSPTLDRHSFVTIFMD